MKKLAVAAVCATILAGAAGVVLGWTGDSGRDTPKSTRVAEGSANPREVAAAARAGENRRAELPARRAPAVAAASEPEADDPDLAPEPPAARDPKEVAKKLSDRLGRDLKDAWSGQTERAISAAFQTGAFAGVNLIEAECRSSMCRIVTSHDDATTQMDYVRTLRMTPPFDQSAGFAEPVFDETGTRTVVYLSRPGEALPAL